MNVRVLRSAKRTVADGIRFYERQRNHAKIHRRIRRLDRLTADVAYILES